MAAKQAKEIVKDKEIYVVETKNVLQGINCMIYFTETDSVDEDLLEKIKSQPGVTDLGNIYLSAFWQEFSDENWEKIEDKFYFEELLPLLK